MDNNWEDGLEELMAGLGNLMRKHGEGLFDTLPSSAYPTPAHSVLTKEHWGVATESLDGKKTYLHVLNAPKSNILRLPKTCDTDFAYKWHFTRAEITGREAGLEKTEDGWAVTLPVGMNWDQDDTVVTLWIAMNWDEV